MNASGQFSLAPTCTPVLAVERFLAAMHKAAVRSYPAWLDVLKAGIDECPLDYDTRRGVFDVHPLDDYYFAAAVGLEAARIRGLFESSMANEIMSAIGERVDAVAGRTDRTVSDLVFTIVSQVDVTVPDSHQKPHDQVIAIILQRMGVPMTTGTRHLTSDLLFRHHLGQPLALEIPKWWPAFHAKYTLARLPAEASANLPPQMTVSSVTIRSGDAPRPVRRRSVARRII